jgi:hypothetical protein
MAWPPSIQDFKDKFTREFVYGTGGDMVRDEDIQSAYDEAVVYFNQSLLPTEALQKIAWLYLSAHIMVLNIQTAGGLSAVNLGQGTRNVGEGVIVSKGVGQVNVTYQVPPPNVAKSAILLYFFRTDFGQRYMQIIYPMTAGPAVVVDGPTPDQWNAE